MVPPLRDASYLVDCLADVTSCSRGEVARRLYREHRELGVNVREEFESRRLKPYSWSEELSDFYPARRASRIDPMTALRCE